MNYIDLINTGWELREQGIISAHEHDLYNYLIHKCNRLNWKNPFLQPTEIVCAVLGVNRNAFIARRNRLQQLGLISFKKGRARLRPAEYKLLTAEPVPLNSNYKNKGKDEYKEISKTENKTFRKTIRHNLLQKPSVEDIAAYCTGRGNDVDAQVFFDFYQAKDWMIGRNKMKDWQAAVRVWEKKLNNDGDIASKKASRKLYEEF